MNVHERCCQSLKYIDHVFHLIGVFYEVGLDLVTPQASHEELTKVLTSAMLLTMIYDVSVRCKTLCLNDENIFRSMSYRTVARSSCSSSHAHWRTFASKLFEYH